MKISIIGLGGIAKKYYLPILSTDAALGSADLCTYSGSRSKDPGRMEDR